MDISLIIIDSSLIQAAFILHMLTTIRKYIIIPVTLYRDLCNLLGIGYHTACALTSSIHFSGTQLYTPDNNNCEQHKLCSGRGWRKAESVSIIVDTVKLMHISQFCLGFGLKKSAVLSSRTSRFFAGQVPATF